MSEETKALLAGAVLIVFAGGIFWLLHHSEHLGMKEDKYGCPFSVPERNRYFERYCAENNMEYKGGGLSWTAETFSCVDSKNEVRTYFAPDICAHNIAYTNKKEEMR